MGRTDVIKQKLQSLGAVYSNEEKGTIYFYLDYTTGEFFVVKSGEKELSLLCSLSRIQHSLDFDNLISK